MIKYENKTIFFSGYGEKIDKTELVNYCIQNGATMCDTLEDANVIIQGFKTPVHLEEKFYLLSKDGIELITIETLEQEFSKNLNIDSILMGLKISKDKERVIKLLKNRYFDDAVFVKILKYYDWQNTGIYDNDDNRDISTTITSRFCSLVEENHNIQYSPIGIYYTALETSNEKLLEIIYSMPEYQISDKNAKQNQPLSLKEVVALNPNSSKVLLMQVYKDGLKELKNNNNSRLLEFLAQNESLNKLLKSNLYTLNNKSVLINLIRSNNVESESIEKLLENSEYRHEILKSVQLDEQNFSALLNANLTEAEYVSLSSNKSIQKEQMDILFEQNIDNVNINLLKNNSCPKDKIKSFLSLNDKIYNITIAHNEDLDEEIYEKLYTLNDFDVELSLAYNIKTPQKILTKLYEQNKDEINFALSVNTHTPIKILMQLQLNSNLQNNVSNNATYKEFSKNTLGIIQNQNSQFKRNTYMDTI